MQGEAFIPNLGEDRGAYSKERGGGGGGGALI